MSRDIVHVRAYGVFCSDRIGLKVKPPRWTAA
jgi:hypothetical protein